KSLPVARTQHAGLDYNMLDNQLLTSVFLPADPDKCCFSFSNLEIPEREVESYYMTNLECPRHGIIFITNRKVCADLCYLTVSKN
uniref:Chemokine interleukin-8-like domain-containing protein n=1 Tax=Sinocyclocheilus grahami TaxID=75366 RepID=A0A672RWK7_SINGR